MELKRTIMKDHQKKEAELSKMRQRKIAELERKAALQEKIGELNAKLAAIVEHSSDAIIGKDLNGVITSWNKGAETIYGYTAEEAIGRPLSMLAPAGNSDDIPMLLEKIRHGESLENYETMREGKDGRKVYVSLSISPIISKGEIIGASTIARDITRRKQAEEQIRLAKEEWEQTFDAMPDIVAVIDEQHIIKRANRALADRVGVERDELIGGRCYEMICGLEKPLANCPGKRAVMACKEQVEERFLNKLNGYFLISCTPVTACYGSGNCFVEVCRDITKRNQDEEALRESEEKFRSLVETTSDWIWEVDEKGIYTYVSPTVRSILGYEPEEVMGKTPFDLMPREEAERVARQFQSFIENREHFSALENINRHKDGRLIVLETSGLPVFSANGIFRGYRGIDRDISERKQGEIERERLLAELQEALANVKKLSGMLPICAYCKKIRDDKGYWEEVASYITKHSEALFSHGICPDCYAKVSKELENYKKDPD